MFSFMGHASRQTQPQVLGVDSSFVGDGMDDELIRYMNATWLVNVMPCTISVQCCYCPPMASPKAIVEFEGARKPA